MLAGGGDKQIREILKKAAGLKGPARARLLMQILVLAGLRGMVGQVQSEMRSMGVVIDIRKNPFLLKIQQDALEEGEAKGKAEALAGVLLQRLEAEFGPLPKWAKDRIAKADAGRLHLWVTKSFKASGTSIEGIIGKR